MGTGAVDGRPAAANTRWPCRTFTVTDLDGSTHVLRRLEGQSRARQLLGDLVRALPRGNSRPGRAAEQIPRPARRDRDLRGRDRTEVVEAVRDREEDQLPDRDDQRRSCRRCSPASPRCRRPSCSIRTDRLPRSTSASCTPEQTEGVTRALAGTSLNATHRARRRPRPPERRRRRADQGRPRRRPVEGASRAARRGPAGAQQRELHLRLRPERRQVPHRRSAVRREPAGSEEDRREVHIHSVNGAACVHDGGHRKTRRREDAEHARRRNRGVRPAAGDAGRVLTTKEPDENTSPRIPWLAFSRALSSSAPRYAGRLHASPPRVLRCSVPPCSSVAPAQLRVRDVVFKTRLTPSISRSTLKLINNPAGLLARRT